MRRERIIESIEAALAPDGEAYKTAESQASGLTGDRADRCRDYYLSRPVAETLGGESEFAEQAGFLIHQPNGYCTLDRNQAAATLISRAREAASPEAAVTWLEKVLQTEKAIGYCVMPLWGISCEERIELTDHIELLPVSLIPESPQKEAFLAPRDPMSAWDALSTSSLWHPPKVALVCQTLIDPVITPCRPGPAPELTRQPWERRLLEDVRLALTAAGPCAPTEVVYWFQYEDADLEDATMISGARSYVHLEIVPQLLEKYQNVDAELATRVVGRFLKLRKQKKEWVSIALERLNQAIRRQRPGDQATEISIALETLLTEGAGENTYKVGLRSALLIGGDLKTRRNTRATIGALYTMRNSLVHEGKVSKEVKVINGGKVPVSDVADRAIHICACVIRKVIQRGDVPNWYDFELSGGR